VKSQKTQVAEFPLRRIAQLNSAHTANASPLSNLRWHAACKKKCGTQQGGQHMPAKNLMEFLDANRVKYTTITHSTAYTSQEIAATTHIRGQELAKTVIVKVDGHMAMAVLPAAYQVNLSALRAVVGANNLSLATEAEFKGLFPECETGAMSPFGNIYGMPVFVEESLTRDREIAFNAGTHKELIQLAYEDFAQLVHPKILRFSSVRAA
jgi:Ala-tRNA(Pro) deacylase